MHIDDPCIICVSAPFNCKKLVLFYVITTDYDKVSNVHLVHEKLQDAVNISPQYLSIPNEKEPHCILLPEIL